MISAEIIELRHALLNRSEVTIDVIEIKCDNRANVPLLGE